MATKRPLTPKSARRRARWTREEVAELLGRSVSHVARLLAQGRLRHDEAEGRRRWVSAAELERFLRDDWLAVKPKKAGRS